MLSSPTSTCRGATAADFSAALATLVAAFAHDPVWGGWAFPEQCAAAAQRRALFGLWLRDAMVQGTVLISGDCEAVALWYPPGAAADTEAYRRELQSVAVGLGSHATVFLQGCALFTANAPPAGHWYLALLAVRLDRRGLGMGMGLLRACLAAPEFQTLPAYLESTNPRNLQKYQRLGFARLGEFVLPGAGPRVDRMWREP